jgi:hypothetical protein
VRRIIIDEFSMLSQGEIVLVESRCRLGKARPDLEFGGIPTMITGCMAQLPSIGGVVMWSQSRHSQVAQEGASLFCNPKHAIFLQVVMHQQGEDAEQVRFRELLGRLRNSVITEADWLLLSLRSKSSIGEEKWQSGFAGQQATYIQ